MLTRSLALSIVIGLPCFLALGCEELGFDSGPSRDAEVTMFNDSDREVRMMGPGEPDSDNFLVQPGGGRVVVVEATPNGEVSFRATNDGGLFSIATWLFVADIRVEFGSSVKQGEVTLTAQNRLTCSGDLFANC